MKRRQLIHNRSDLKDRRRQLRRNATPAEAFLWSALRGAKLDGKKFRRQHSIGPYIADFYCPECRVIVELDGAVHGGMLNVERDDSRTRFLARFDILVLRFENKQVFENRGYVLEVIRAALKGRSWGTSPRAGKARAALLTQEGMPPSPTHRAIE